MSFVSDARKLANYITELSCEFELHEPTSHVYNHIGALYTDIILQAGLNYNSVVKPRVDYILKTYPNHNTILLFQELIKEISLEKIINWKHPLKIQRMEMLLEFSTINGIDNTLDFLNFITKTKNRTELLKLNGIGPKTIDYSLRLLNCDNVAVDRHIYSFVEYAGIYNSNYHEVKKIVEYAADFLNIRRACIDYSIWKYMSSKARNNSPQLQFDLN